MKRIMLRVSPTGRGGDQVVVDGQDLAPICAGYTLTTGAGHVPVLALQLRMRQVGEVTGEARVAVDAQTHQALVALGWTPPPAEEEETDRGHG